MNVERTEKVFRMFAEKVIQNAKGILNAKGKNTSGNLISSLDYKLKVYPSGALELDFIVPDYAKFVDKGVKGSSGKPHPKRGMLAEDSDYQFKSKNLPKGVIDKWSVRKGLKSVRDEKGRFIKRKSLVYLMGRSIALYGLEATHFFSDAFQNSYKDMPQQVMRAYASDVEKFMKFATKNI